MYPIGPSTLVLDATLARTGFPVASLLMLATLLILGGMFFMRASRIVQARTDT